LEIQSTVTDADMFLTESKCNSTRDKLWVDLLDKKLPEPEDSGRAIELAYIDLYGYDPQ